MQSKIQLITPEVAATMLATNQGNRPINKANLNYLTQQMLSGQFQETGQTLQFGQSGRLLDGQHRLLALQRAEKSYHFVIVSDVPDAVFAVLDQGARRGVGDLVSVAGHSQGIARAAIAKRVMLADRNLWGSAMGNNGERTISGTDILAFCDRRAAELDAALSDAHVYSARFPLITRTDWGVYSYLLTRLSASGAADFLSQLASGAGLPEKHVVLFVRNKLISTAGGVLRMPSAVRAALVFQAWNRVRAGRPMGMVKYLPSEEFPAPQ